MKGTNSDSIQIQKYLHGMDYPASKDDLIDCAKENGAPKEVLDQLDSLRSDHFNSPVEISKHIHD